MAQTIRIDDYRYVGNTIYRVCENMAREATDTGNTYEFMFNGVLLTAKPSEYPERMVERYNEAFEKNHRDYLLTEAALNADRNRLDEIWNNYYRLDPLLTNLCVCDMMSDPVQILNWFKEVQPLLDDTHVYSPKAVILQAFHSAGYEPNVNTNDAYDADDKDNTFRYIVGQCLDGIARIGSPHPMCVQFIAEWLARWD